MAHFTAIIVFIHVSCTHIFQMTYTAALGTHTSEMIFQAVRRHRFWEVICEMEHCAHFCRRHFLNGVTGAPFTRGPDTSIQGCRIAYTTMDGNLEGSAGNRPRAYSVRRDRWPVDVARGPLDDVQPGALVG